ncbi:hypothetical protein PR048_001506 [Dryococelus australis]|uniref:Uncharacterized protein n=1 Tax=Dryococelus australis TaxID=614101 RepID=A0ABQ9IHJ2_9NEOP|nr:hypothetical protein PR048_001506 [Dryococelus australis]
MRPTKDPVDPEGIRSEVNYLLMKYGRHFLLEDNRGSKYRICVVGCEKGKSALTSCASLFVKGNIKSSSNSLVSYLSPTSILEILGKKLTLFQQSEKNNIPGWNTIALTMDFEMATIISAETLFPEAEMFRGN